MNKTTNNQKKELNIFLFLFLGFVILQHLGKIFLNLMNLLTPQSEYFYISKNGHLYSIVLSIAMIVVVIGTMSKKKWGVIGFFFIQIINLFGIQALSDGQADLSSAFGVTCVLCAIFALLLCLRSKGESAWEIIFEQKESKPKKNYLFELRNMHWFKKENKEKEHRNENSKVKEDVTFDIPLISEEKMTILSDEPRTSDKHKRKPFIKVFLIVLSVIVIVSIGVGSYFPYMHYTDNEYLMNKANETFKNGEIKKALAMYEELADKKDYVPAKTKLALIYLVNDSVALDSVKGKNYLEEAALTDTLALSKSIYLYLGANYKGANSKDYKKCEYYSNIAIRRGVVKGAAYYALGQIACDKEDYTAAFYNWDRSSTFDNTWAIDNLGWMTYYGIGCKIDYAKSYNYFKKVLELDKDDDYALYYMGLFYLNGIVVKKDINQAREYFKKAAELGNEDAMNEYAKLKMSLKLVI